MEVTLSTLDSSGRKVSLSPLLVMSVDEVVDRSIPDGYLLLDPTSVEPRLSEDKVGKNSGTREEEVPTSCTIGIG